VSGGHATARDALQAAGDVGTQLAFELFGDEAGGTVDLPDLDLERAERLDAAEQALLEAVFAAAAKPRPCRCGRPLLDRDEWDGLMHCIRCGREVPHGG
jgi:hypothetical protein